MLIAVDADSNDKRLSELNDLRTIFEKQARDLVDERNNDGRNDISKLLLLYYKRWPAIPQLQMSNKPSAKNVIEYYDNQADSLIHQYFQHAVDIGCVKSYEQVRNQSESIALRQYLKKSDINLKKDVDYPDLFSRMNYESFIPETDNTTICFDRKEYFHIEVLERHPKSKTFKLRLSIYSGGRNDWMLIASITLTIKFKPANGKIGCEWLIHDSMPYEKYVSAFISDMPWSKEQKYLWEDIFNAPENKDAYRIIRITPTKSKSGIDFDDYDHDIPICGDKDYEMLRKVLSPYCRIETVGGFDDLMKNYEKANEKKLILHYVRMMAALAVMNENPLKEEGD